MIKLVAITDGRGACFERTISSFDSMVKGDSLIVEKILVDDSVNEHYANFLDRNYGDFTIIHNKTKKGFGGAIQTGWFAGGNTKFVFHLEDDFIFNRPLDLSAMMRVLDAKKYLAQLVCLRQPWNEAEEAAGGIIECWPHEYYELTDLENYWVEHRLFFSTNPSLIPRRTILKGWPDGDRSEETFSKMLLEDGNVRFAFWGRRNDPPLVHHIGQERVGVGY